MPGALLTHANSAAAAHPQAPASLRPHSARDTGVTRRQRPLGAALRLPPASGATSPSPAGFGVGLADVAPSSGPQLNRTPDASVLEGLRTLAGGASGSSSAPRPRSAVLPRRPLLGGSSISGRANVRAGELDGLCTDTEAHMVRVMTEAANAEDPESREARFQELLESVEAAVAAGMEGEALAARPLRAGDNFLVDFAPQEQRYYAVPLPTRAVEVMINLARAGGGPLPAMYASSSPGATKPTKQEHELEGEAGEVHYRHEGEPDRTVLQLLIVGLDEHVEVRIRCSVRRPEEEAPPNGYSVRRRVEEKLAHMRQDPAELEARLQAAKTHQREKRKEQRQVAMHFAAQHKGQILARRPSRCEEWNQKARDKKTQQRSLVEQRRLEVERAQETRALRWTNKEEEWQQARLEQAQLHENLVFRPKEWCAKLFVVAYGVGLLARCKARKEEMVKHQRLLRACVSIQSWFLRSLSRWRRRWLYHNATKFRAAAALFSRQTRIVVFNASAPRMKWMLTTHASPVGKHSVGSVIRDYMIKVRRVQRAIRRVNMVREARVEALLLHFSAAQAAAPYQAMGSRRTSECSDGLAAEAAAAVSEVAKKSRRASFRGSKRGGSSLRKTASSLAPDDASPTGSAPSTPISPRSRRQEFAGSRQGIGKSSASGRLAPGTTSFRRSSSSRRKRRSVAGLATCEEDLDADLLGVPQDPGPGRGHKPAFLLEYLARRRKSKESEPEDLLPTWCKRYALRQHVIEMMQSYPERMRKHLELKKELAVELEMRKMGMAIRDLRLETLKKPPKTIELSRLPVLYAETYDSYMAGYYKEVHHDYVRRMRKVWTVWYRVYRKMDVSGSGTFNTRGPPSISTSGPGGPLERLESCSILSPAFDTEQRERNLLRSLQRQLDEFV